MHFSVSITFASNKLVMGHRKVPKHFFKKAVHGDGGAAHSMAGASSTHRISSSLNNSTCSSPDPQMQHMRTNLARPRTRWKVSRLAWDTSGSPEKSFPS